MLIRKHGLPIALLVENEGAQIVTEARAGMTRTAAVYDVSDLIWHVDAEGVRVRDASQLIDTIQSLTGGVPEGPWHDDEGEHRKILPLHSAGLDVLAIYQTQAVHRQIRQLLANLRRQRRLEFPSAVPAEQALDHSETTGESAVSECRVYDVADLVVTRTPAVLTHQPWGGGGFFRVPSPLPLSGLQTHMQESVLATLKQQAQTYLALFNRSGRPSTIKKPVPPKQVEPPQPAVQTPPSTPARSVVETDFDALLLLMDELTPATKKPVSVVNSSAVKSLATRRTPGEHREIARLLAALRACRDTGRADWSAPLPAGSRQHSTPGWNAPSRLTPTTSRCRNCSIRWKNGWIWRSLWTLRSPPRRERDSNRP